MGNTIFSFPMLWFTHIYNPVVNYSWRKWSKKSPLSLSDIIKYIQQGDLHTHKKNPIPKKHLKALHIFLIENILLEEKYSKIV